MGSHEGRLEQLRSLPSRLPRFALDQGELVNDRVEFGRQPSWQMARVLRLQAGQVVAVMVGERELAVRLEQVDPSRASGTVLGPVDRFTEPSLTVILLQALLRANRIEMVIQKATELGVAAILPVMTKRTVVRPEAGEVKGQRWARIAKEAAEQSLRLRVPTVFAPSLLAEGLSRARSMQPQARLIALWEEERQTGLVDLLAAPAPAGIILLAGPEGGLEESEVEQVRALGGRTASLGTRILRSETAALVALSLVMAGAGELGRATGAAGRNTCPGE